LAHCSISNVKEGCAITVVWYKGDRWKEHIIYIYHDYDFVVPMVYTNWFTGHIEPADMKSRVVREFKLWNYNVGLSVQLVELRTHKFNL
jgi:hypothetical protein